MTRRSRAEAYVRPLLFQALDAGDIDAAAIDGLTPVQRRAIERQARALLPKVKGQDKEALARLLQRRGAVAAARRQTRSKRSRARIQAGEFLGQVGSPAALRDLLELLHDPNPQVRWSAARGLGQLGHQAALSPLLASLEGSRPMPVDVIADAIFQIRDCPISLLRQGAKSRSAPTRAVAVELLGRFQAFAAADDVIQILERDPSVEVRARAARALGRMSTMRAVEPLMECLDDGPAAVRIQATWALGEIGAPQAVTALHVIMLGPSPQMATVAAAALVAIGPPGVRVLTHVAEGDGYPASIAGEALAAQSQLALSRI